MGGKVLEKTGLDAMLTSRPSRSIGGRYGLGVQVRSWDSLGTSYGHDRFYFPRQKVAIAVQLNIDQSRALRASSRKIVESLMKIIRKHLEYE